jgi:membrane-bound lytic murein transglycosylase F
MTTVHLRFGVVCLVVASVWSGVVQPRPPVTSLLVEAPQVVLDQPTTGPEPSVADMELSVADVQRRGTITFLMHHSAASYFLYRGAQMGFEYELAREFAKELGVELEVRTPPAGVALTTWLREGKGDIIAGLATADDSDLEPLLVSVPYLETTAAILTPKEEQEASADVLALSGKRLIVQPDSPYASRILPAPWTLPVPPVLRDTVSDNPFGEAIHAVLQNRAAGALLVSPLARIVHAVYPKQLQTVIHVTTPVRLVWAVRPGQHELLQVMNRYLQTVSRSGLRKILYEKYFVDARHLRTTANVRESTLLTRRLSRYDHLIVRHAEKAGFDWRLVAALIFEESRFDPKRVSERGAYGLMQITPIAAQEIGMKDYTTPPRNIEAGVKYLQTLSRQFPYGQWRDRLALILASYVIGPGHVEDAQRLALALGYDPHCWAESMEEVLPLLEDPDYRQRTLYGFAQGRHAVQYVNAVLNRYALYSRYIPRTLAPPLVEAQATGHGHAASAAG